MVRKHLLRNCYAESFLVIWLTFSLPAAAQIHSAFHFSVSEGLPSSEVYEVYQDRKGFLWFATDNGVARYDGKVFEKFHVKNGLTDPVVFGFFEDENDNIWFRTFSGRLSYFDGNKIKGYRYNDELLKNGQNGFFNFVYDSNSDELWFTMEHIFGKIKANGESETDSGYTRSFFIKSINGRLLQGADNHFSVKNIIIDDQRFPIQLTDTADFKFFNCIAIRNKIYISIYKDLFEYEGTSLKKVFASKHPIISLSQDRAGNLWVGYLNHGAEIFTAAHKPQMPLFLKDKSVTKVLQDAASGLWFTTLESGVYYVPDFRIENYPLPTPAVLKSVLALGDTVLLGDQSGTLTFVDADTRKVLSKKKYEHTVYALFQDRSKNVWVSAGVEITRFDSKLQKKNMYPARIATHFAEGPHGHVWTLEGIRITNIDKEGRIVQSESPNVIYRALMVDDSVLYLAARTGLHILDKRMRFLQAPSAFAEFKITHIESINDTHIVLATQGNGLFLLNKNEWSGIQFDATNQFIANNIYCILKTDSILWMGTERGLVAASIPDMVRGRMKFYHISRQAGLTSDKINFILSVKENVWAFGDNGFSVIPKSFAKYETAASNFYVKRIIAGKDTITAAEIGATRPIVLPYHNNHLTFAFGHISFSNPEIFLRYRISPKSEWINTAEQTLQFFSLAPGDYLFELQYSRNNIEWITPFKPLAFIIDSPWWLKWYTLAGALGFIIFLGYLYSRFRQSIYKQKNHYLSIINNHQQKLIQSEVETVERERKRIARELHDGVGTNLTAIKLMVNQLLQKRDAAEACDVEEQFQIALRELRDIIYGMAPPSLSRYGLFTALKNYVAKLNKSSNPVIALQIYGREIKNYEFNIMVFRIVQELISNSIKHSSAKNITIHINSFEDVLNIVYEDDGIGFSYDTIREGLGLDNIESRIQSVNGTLKFDSGDHGISYTIDIPLNSIRETA